MGGGDVTGVVTRDLVGVTSAGFDDVGEASLELSDELSLLVRAAVDAADVLVCQV